MILSLDTANLSSLSPSLEQGCGKKKLSARILFLKNVFGCRIRRKSALRSRILFASTELMHRPRSDSLHFDIENTYHIRVETWDFMLPATLLVLSFFLWCRIPFNHWTKWMASTRVHEPHRTQEAVPDRGIGAYRMVYPINARWPQVCHDHVWIWFNPPPIVVRKRYQTQGPAARAHMQIAERYFWVKFWLAGRNLAIRPGMKIGIEIRDIAAKWKLVVWAASRAWWRCKDLEHLYQTGGHDSMYSFNARFGGANACYRRSDFWGSTTFGW